MYDLRTLEAIDDALQTPMACGCGKRLTIVERHDNIWLACPDRYGPSRLPSLLRKPIRNLFHGDRLFVAEARAETHQQRADRLMAA